MTWRLLAGSAAVLLGYAEVGSTLQGLSVAPEFLWELLLGIWLLVRGFSPAALGRTASPGRPAMSRVSS